MDMTQKFTAEEVRAVAASFARVFNEGVSSMLNAYAETLSKPADSGRVTDEQVSSAMQAYIDESGIEDTRAGEYLPIDDEAMRAAITATLAAQGQGDRDAYEGARHDLLDWKHRALSAESILRSIGYRGIVPVEPPASPAGVPDGWLLVPRKPTEAMIDDGGCVEVPSNAYHHSDIEIGNRAAAEVWKCMLAAAPSAPEGDGGAE